MPDRVKAAYAIAIVAVCMAAAWVALAGVITFSSVHVAGTQVGVVYVEVGRTRVQFSVVQLPMPSPQSNVASAR